jgi:HD-GYP domain-containing protein (c-di-GMP phosphodiesterase class II)
MSDPSSNSPLPSSSDSAASTSSPPSSPPDALAAFRAGASPDGGSTESASGSTSALPEAALQALDEARRLVAAQSSVEDEKLFGLRAQVDHLHAELGLAHESMSLLQRERDEILRQREILQRERDQIAQSYAAEQERARAAAHAAQASAHAHAQMKAAFEHARAAHEEALAAHEQTRAEHARAQAAYEQALAAERRAQQEHEREAAAHAQTLAEKERVLAAHEREAAAHAQAREQHAREVAAHQQTKEEHARAQQAHAEARAAHEDEKQARREEQARTAEEQARREEEQAAHKRERDAEHARLVALLERNKRLRERLLDVYGELHARDLPSLILQVCVNLTRSQCGLFVESDGDGTLANIGLEEMPQFIVDDLYGWTRRVAREQEPTHENDSTNLPDGSKLVNLAALPVSLHSELQGVILVANKRDEAGNAEGYTEEDTELLVAIGRHAGLAMENRRLSHELGHAFQSTVAVLADAIEAKDAYTRGHCQSVSDLAVQVAERLGFEGDALQHIRYAALLHDVGKIGVPDGILLKPGRLLPEEFMIIQRHAQIGRDLIARVPSMGAIAPIVMHHHERIDGTGYPNGLEGDAISLASRIICVADAFDAMTTPRPYRDPVSIPEAIAELKRCSGTHFDTLVVNTITDVLQENA